MLQLRTPEDAVQWLRSQGCTGLQTDSRQVRPGDAFVAGPGAAVDGRAFLAQALRSGAVACLMEAEGAPTDEELAPTVATYVGLRGAAGAIASLFFGEPSQAMAVLAVTGTNGKTSTAWWLAQALSQLPAPWTLPCGVIGTLGVGQPPNLVANGLTTPDPVLLQRSLWQMQAQGMRACAIEASSIGIAERRLDATALRVAVFTNFTQDHLDYHGSMASYWEAKRQLFAWPGLAHAVVNVDDPQGVLLADELTGSLDLWTVSAQRAARLQARDIRHSDHGMVFDVAEGDAVHTVYTQAVGHFNVLNLLGVLAAMRCLGVPLADAVRACTQLLPVPGRMQRLGGEGQPVVAVDYAHTPDALAQALQALRPLAQTRGGQLWVVMGCGGDRDAAKRPLMGAIAAQHADRVWVTSDNPRSERPEAIVAQILLGLVDNRQVDVEVDRALAIRGAIGRASANDVVLVAGKGHEATQEIAGVRHAFSDVDHASQALQAWKPLPKIDAAAPMLPLSQLAAWLDGARVVGDATTVCLRVHTDTRSITAGDLFVALRGERFDANDLLHDAKARGAGAVLCHAGLPDAAYPQDLPRIEVADTRAALAQLATRWRAQFDLPVIAVTGSNGKTTVTQMVAAILDAYAPGGHALATQGNFNNDIGVPLTLLRLRQHHRLAVVELGMNHPGEIAALAAMTQPTVALVNNAQREHLEFMHTVEAVAQENGNVLTALSSTGVAVFPQDDAHSAVWRKLAEPRPIVEFSAQPDSMADVVCTHTEWAEGAWAVQARSPQGALTYRLAIAGRHNVKNSLAAAACALAAGVSPEAVHQGLSVFKPVKGRCRTTQLVRPGVNCTLVDDTYNANPDSVQAAIAMLAELPAPRMLVLGDMGEVGEQGPEFHAEAGRAAREHGLEHVLALGTLAAHVRDGHPGAQHFDAMEGLLVRAEALLPEVASVLVKGSRFMRMERVVEALGHPLPQKEGLRDVA
jgi:MurE/MurF fusion protein